MEPSDTDVVSTARQHALGDLPRRTAARFPDKMAIVDGETALTFARARRPSSTGPPRRSRPRDCARATGSRCCRTTAGSSSSLDFATARVGVVLVPVNFMLGADEIAFILDHSGRPAFVVEDALVRGGRPGARAPRPRDRCAAGSGRSAPRRRTAGTDVGDWFAQRRRARRTCRRRRRPGADDVHLRHRVAAQGRAADEPGADVAVRLLRRRRRHERRRRRAAHAAALPLRPARLLPRRRRLPRRDQHHPARPRPGDRPAPRSPSRA